MTKSEFVYTTYIKTTPEKLWKALTNAEFMKQYWFGTRCESEWRAGSPWQMIAADGTISDSGEILEAEAPKRLVIKWRNEFKPELKAEGYSRCVFDIESVAGIVKLTVTHSIDKPAAKFIDAVSGGWPKILSNLKSLLEMGQIALAENVNCQGR